MASTHKTVRHTKSKSAEDIIINLEDIDFYESVEKNSCVVIVNTSPQNIAPVIEALKQYKKNEEEKENVCIGVYVEDISEVIENRRKV